MNALKWLLALVFAFTGLACTCKKKTVNATPTAKTAVQKNQEAQQKEEPQKPKIYPEEVYGDPAIFKGPRFQFLMDRTDTEELDLFMYSMALDGTDVRRVISKDILFSDVIAIANQDSLPSRSPDNRYVVFLGYVRVPDFDYRVILIDLKKRTSRVVARLGMTPIKAFLWTPDSKSFYYFNFNDNYKKFKYNVDTGKLQATPGCPFWRPRITHDGKYFLDIKRETLEFAKVKTCKVVKKIKLPHFGSSNFNYSFDTSHVVHHVGQLDPDDVTSTWMWTELRKQPKQIKVFLDYRIPQVIIGVNNNTLNYASCFWKKDVFDCKIVHHNVKTGKTKGYDLPDPIEKISIFNLKPTTKQ